MLFTDSSEDRAMERQMRQIPNYIPRGYGLYIIRPACVQTEFAEYTMLLLWMVGQIKHALFQARFHEEEKNMFYRSETHHRQFDKALSHRYERTPAMLSALYLLCADRYLWSRSQDGIKKDKIYFEEIRIRDAAPEVYCLFKAAQDLYCGSRHLTISDLSDRELVPPWLFQVICNAMAIRRCGMRAVELAIMPERTECYGQYKN